MRKESSGSSRILVTKGVAAPMIAPAAPPMRNRIEPMFSSGFILIAATETR